MPELHSKVVGGSTAARVLACPASIDLVAKAPPQGSSSYANKGTALHSAMEYLLDTTVRRKRKPEDLIGLTFNNIAITKEDVRDAVIPALEYFNEKIGRHGYRYEQEIMAEFPGIPGAFGTTDVVAFPREENLVIFDWKFGSGVPVSAEMNKQLMYYACCALTHYGLWRKVKIIDMHICQPLIDDGNSRCVISIQQLRAFRHQLIKAVNGPRTQMETGSHCRWCAAAPTCPAKKAEVAAAMAWRMPAVAGELADAMAMVDSLSDWINSVKDAVHTALDKGATVPGYKLVEKRATRKWAVDDAEVRRYLLKHGLTEDQFAPRDLVSAPQAEKLLKPLGAKLDETKIKAESTGFTVAHESDKRAAVSTGRNLADLASLLKP